jgi:hypothetical protein
VSSLRARKVSLLSLLVAWAASCAVFPDEAVLPEEVHAGDAGASGAVVEAGAGAGAAMATGPAGGVGGVPSVEAGAPPALAGAGGAEPVCSQLQQVLSVPTADTWIDAARPSTGHGPDDRLFVVGGTAERRALLQFTLPAAVPGATLLRATITLQLASNDDVSLAERVLEMSLLEQQVDEGRTTWNNWGNGASRRWSLPGGDFGPALAFATLPALSMSGEVEFDVTALAADAFSATAVPLPLIVREVGAPPTPPAELAFTSRQGDASKVPELLIEYCP